MLVRLCVSFSLLILALPSLSRADAQVEAPTEPAVVSEDKTATALAAPPAPGAGARAGKGEVPLPWHYTFRDLNAMQAREADLWTERYTLSSGVAAAAIGLGFPLSGLLISWGGVLVADANSYYEDEGSDERRIGAIMLTAGIIALAGTAVSIWHVARVRKRRDAIDSELRQLGGSRTAIERMIQAQLMAQP